MTKSPFSFTGWKAYLTIEEKMKRLKSRIDALEAATATNSLDISEAKSLVQILARRDAHFWPWRFQIHSRTPFTEIRQRQREYLSGQTGVTIKADGAHQWKEAAELRQRLIASGLINAVHSSGQVQSVFLTAKGEAIARGLVGCRLWTFQRARPLLAVLRIRSEESSVRAVRESMLFGIDGVGDPADWNGWTEMILPLLTCGIVAANSDTQGRACYTPVDEVPEPPEIVVSIAADPDADELYISTFNNERAVLETLEPRDPHEVFVPLPATGWGWQCHFPQETAT
jgi:hypothetical protein